MKSVLLSIVPTPPSTWSGDMSGKAINVVDRYFYVIFAVFVAIGAAGAFVISIF